MVQLRNYQLEAVNACARALRDTPSTLIVAATGAGKSLILASIAQRVCARYPEARILVLCYVQEILESNNEACSLMGLDSGIYSASLGRRDTGNRVIHASRDSLGGNPLRCGAFDMVIVDEAHMLSDKKESRYANIISALAPRWLVGLTATPYRLDGGVIYGKRKYFESLAFDISHEMLVSQGFLVPYVFPPWKPPLVDVSGVPLKNGDYDQAHVSSLVCDRDIVNRSLEIWAEHAQDRKCSLFFCHSLAHARLCVDVFKERFPDLPVGYLDGCTNKHERAALIEDTRAGKYRAVMQVSTMTTGTNIPIIDCIVWLRPTASAALFVQGSGRGSRLFPEKKDCLIVDLVGNTDTFGSLYEPLVPKGKRQKMNIEFTPEELRAMGIDPEEMKSDPPMKDCPQCGALLPGPARKCDACGKLFITLTELYTDSGPGQLIEVMDYEYSYTDTKSGDPCLKVTYFTRQGRYTEWIPYTKPWARGKFVARKKFLHHGIIPTHLKVTPTTNPRFPKLTPFIIQPEQLKEFSQRETSRNSFLPS